MCAAKLERTSYVLRSVWPNVKHAAKEQSATFAQSANEGSFIRKNSHQKADAVAGASRCSRPTNVNFVQKKCQIRMRLAPRQIAPDLLNASSQTRGLVAKRCVETRSFCSSVGAISSDQQKFAKFTPLATAVPRDDRLRSGVSIDELIQGASEKYHLNKDFWGKYTDIPAMAQASEKADILQIIENFVLIHRKHVYLFQRLKNTVLRNLAFWSAPDLAVLCHSWAQLGFLHEDLCVAMAERVTATAHMCNAQELCWLMDAYATSRCFVQSVTEEISKQTVVSLEEFTMSQLCLHVSSFARLNIQNEALFEMIAERLMQRTSKMNQVAFEDEMLTARDLTLAAYSYAKLGFFFPDLFKVISLKALEVIRDFTARDLQMLVVAYARAQHQDPDLLVALSLQAQRRIAQFSAESLTLMLRSMAFFDMRDSVLFTRAVAQLPRMILTFRPADVTTLLNAFAAVQVHSVALFDVVTPFILEKAPLFTPADWLSALRSYSALGHRDMLFLSALRLHLQASKLSLQQVCAALLDCSRLSFSGSSEPLVEAAVAKMDVEGVSSSDVAAQLYSALLLLGHSMDHHTGDEVHAFLKSLALQLRGCDVGSSLSRSSCINLCYATLLAPPVSGHGEHPVAAGALVERCLSEASASSPEEKLMLRVVLRALELLPWNRWAVMSAAAIDSDISSVTAEEVEGSYAGIPSSLRETMPESFPCDLPTPYALTALSHLAPLAESVVPALPSNVAAAASQESDSRQSRAPPVPPVIAGPLATQKRWQGIFLAKEINTALQEISAALSAVGIENRLVLDRETEVHVAVPEWALSQANRSSGSGSTAAESKGSPEDGSKGRREIGVLWGSTLHYISDVEASSEPPRLSPAAKFQVALLRATSDIQVIVVPYWWWPSCHSLEGKGHRLANFLTDAEVRKEAARRLYISGPPSGVE